MGNKFERLRSHIPAAYRPTANNFVKGLLEAWAEGDDGVAQAILDTKAQLFVATASQEFLDRLGSNVGVVRPASLGMGDIDFRNLVPALSFAPKQVRDVIQKLLEIWYKPEAVYANMVSEAAEPYNLSVGDTLRLVVNKENAIDITFSFAVTDFLDISNATALEVANAINKQAVNLPLRASEYYDSIAKKKYVRLRTTTAGPTGEIRIGGGTAQCKLRFPRTLDTTQDIGTEWDLVPITGDLVRMEYTGAGPNPSLSEVHENDLLIISGAFDDLNKGNFTISSVVLGAIVDGVTPGRRYTGFYVEFANAMATAETVTQTAVYDTAFFYPKKHDVNAYPRPAVLYEVNHKEVVVILPATAAVINRTEKGSAHLHTNSEQRTITIDAGGEADFFGTETIVGMDAMYTEETVAPVGIHTGWAATPPWGWFENGGPTPALDVGTNNFVIDIVAQSAPYTPSFPNASLFGAMDPTVGWWAPGIYVAAGNNIVQVWLTATDFTSVLYNFSSPVAFRSDRQIHNYVISANRAGDLEVRVDGTLLTPLVPPSLAPFAGKYIPMGWLTFGNWPNGGGNAVWEGNFYEIAIGIGVLSLGTRTIYPYEYLSDSAPGMAAHWKFQEAAGSLAVVDSIGGVTVNTVWQPTFRVQPGATTPLEGETIVGLQSGATATVFKRISDDGINTTIGVIGVVGGFILDEVVMGFTSQSLRVFNTLISTTSSTGQLDASIEPNRKFGVQDITGTFLVGEGLIGRTDMRMSYANGPFDTNELLTGASAMHLTPPYFGNFVVGETLTGLTSGQTAIVVDVVRNKIDDAITLQISSISGTFTAGELVTGSISLAFGTLDKVVQTAGATARIETLGHYYSHNMVHTLRLETGVFQNGEIVVGGTLGSKAVIGEIASAVGTVLAIETTDDFESPYIYNPQATFTPSAAETETTEDIQSGQYKLVLKTTAMGDDFLAGPGYILFDYGTANEEGPVRYTSKPNDTSLIIDPSFVFQKDHPVGTSVRMVRELEPTVPQMDGSDYAAYVTGLAEARLVLQELIRSVVAAGVTVRFIVVFPEYIFQCYNTNEVA